MIPTSQIRIRRAVPDDAAPICRVAIAAVEAGWRQHYEDPVIAAWVATSTPKAYRAVIEEAGCVTLVAEHGEGIVGFGVIRTTGQRIRALYVHPECAGSGVGTALLRALEEVARQSGLDRLHLDASLNAVGFYARAGYQEAGRLTYPLPGGCEIA